MQRDWGSSRVSCSRQNYNVAARIRNRDSYGDPQNVVRVNGEAGAADVLLVTGRVDDDGVLWGACFRE
jgi:ribosomal protein L18E